MRDGGDLRDRRGRRAGPARPGRDPATSGDGGGGFVSAAGAPTLTPQSLGRTGLLVTPVCVGGAPLGSRPENFGYEVPAGQGVATVRRFLQGPLNFIDTAAGYSDGQSELRIGTALREVGGLPDGFVLATKVDRNG